MLTSNVTSEIMNAINKQFSLQRSIPEVHSEYNHAVVMPIC